MSIWNFLFGNVSEALNEGVSVGTVNSSSAKMTINGMRFEVSRGQVFVNGQRYTPDEGGDPTRMRAVLEGVREFLAENEFSGGWVDEIDRVLFDDDATDTYGNQVDLAPKVLELGADGRITGNVYGDLTVQGGATLVVEGNVEGSVKSEGDVSCGKVGGSVVGKDVNCGKVGGSANATGNINCGKVGGSVLAMGQVTNE